MRATREKRSIGTCIATLAATMALLPMLLAGESIPPVGKFAESNSFHLLLEKDRGHFYPVLPSTTEVDANADLIVNFRGPENPAVGSPGPDWQQTSNLLKFVKENVQERVRFAAELRAIDLSNEQQATNFSDRLKKFNNESIQKINGALTNAGIDEGMRLSIYTGAFDGKKNALRPYENLGRWLSNRLDTLTKELKQFASNRTAEVSVQAFHLPKRGSEKALHVDNYDRIPAGELRPIDRLGLRMNDAEQAEFQAKLKAAQEGKAAASEIMTNSAQLKAIFKAKMEAVRVRLEELEKLLENQAAVDWTTNFAASPIGLALKAQAETNPSPEVKKAANDLLADIQKFHDGFKEASALYLKIRGLTGPLRRGEQADLAEMVSSMQMIAGGLQTFVSQVNTLVTQVSQWPALLERSTKNLEVVGSHLAADVRDKIIPKELSSLVAEFSEKFPATANILKTASSIFQSASSDGGVAAMAESVGGAAAGVETDQQWLALVGAPPGRVELARSGLAPGDSIKVRISYREPPSQPGGEGRLITSEDFKVETELMGLHRVFDAGLIFARGLRGDAAEKEWKPNVAAAVTWHYRIRRPEDGSDPNFAKRTWNWLDPGFGLHLASLDQGEDSVELGVGPSLSLWDGLVQAGIGININNHERPYVFFGIGLLEALDQAKKLRNK